MRLSKILSDPPSVNFVETERFLNTKLAVGKQRKIDTGKVALNFYCTECADSRTFLSDAELYCIGVTPRQISIDCVLSCVGECGATVAAWFLIECQDGEDTDKNRQYLSNYIYGIAPKVRVLKYREKLSEKVRLVDGQYAGYGEMFDKAKRAYRDGLGAGAIVYLRKIFENVTVKSADAVGIEYKTYESGNPKNFFELLKKVDEKCAIIPNVFSADGYRLYRELSDVVHGNYDEQVGLQKYEPFNQLVIGIIRNIQNNEAMLSARNLLGWDNGGDSDDES